jgi:hypothetical protein
VDTTEPRPRIFLSYGRADASELAARLTADLANAGFDIWRDTPRLSAGRPWDGQIQEAIGKSDLLLAVLTPHAVRAATIADPRGEDGVCLDEIATARFARPRVPILPILALPCTPPFIIQRLQFIDFTRYQESNSTYVQLLQTLVTDIKALLAGQPERIRDFELAAILFDTYINEKQSRFVGREWLLRDLLAWVDDANGSKVLLIVGPPGIGKTALMAQLIGRNPHGLLSAFHFCRADVAETIDPMRVIEHLCAMIAAQTPEYERALAGLLQHDRHQRPSDPISFAERYLVEPLTRNVHEQRARQAIAVDGLDEGSDPEKTIDVVRLVAHLSTRLPPWLRLILTSRPASDVVRRFSFVNPRVIDANEAENRQDVLAFLRNQLSAGNTEASETSVAALDAAAGGNFLIAKTLGQLVLDKVVDPGHLKDYQTSLSFLYASIIDRLGASAEERRIQVGILQQIATTRRPVAREVIANCVRQGGRFTVGDLNVAFDRLAMLLVNDADGLRLFHQSFFDWLVNESTAYQIDLNEGHKQWATFAMGVLKDDSASGPGSQYAAEQVLAHMRLSGDYDQWLGIVQSPELAARVTSLGVSLWGTLPAEATAVVSLLHGSAKVRLIKALIRFFGNPALTAMKELELHRIDETAGLVAATKATGAFANPKFRQQLCGFLAYSSTWIHLLSAAAGDPNLRSAIIEALEAYDDLFVPLMYLSEDWFSIDGLGMSGQVADVAHGAYSEWTRLANQLEFSPA